MLTPLEGGTFYKTVHRVMDHLGKRGVEIGVERMHGLSGELYIIILKESAAQIRQFTGIVSLVTV